MPRRMCCCGWPVGDQLYVSTDLRTTTGWPEYADDLAQRDDDRWRMYRRCTPVWYGWLVHRLRAARPQLSDDQYLAGRAALIEVRAWMLGQHGAEIVAQAEQSPPSATVRAPQLPQFVKEIPA